MAVLHQNLGIARGFQAMTLGEMEGVFQPLHILLLGFLGIIALVWVVVSLMRKR
jgi:hypothetical protein